MNLQRRALLFTLASLPLLASTPGHAGLLGGGDPKRVEAVPFDFDAAINNPGSIAGDYFGTHTTQSLAGLKKVIIPSFQVRFCLRDDVARTSTFSTASFSSWSSKSAGVTVDLPEEVRQQLTDELYERVVQRLAALGVEVVPIPRDLDLPELQAGIKAMPPSGHIEDLTNAAQRTSKKEKQDADSWLYPWAIHYPSQVTAVAYSGISEAMPPFMSWLREAEMPQMPISTMKIGKAMGTGILTLGFEVRLEKMAFERGSFLGKGATINAEPVLRTRLLGAKLVPDDGGYKPVAVGMGGGRLFPGMNYNGFGIQPIATIMGSPKHGDFPWIEMNGSYGPVVGTGEDGRWLLKPEPEALAKDFRQITDAQLSLIFHLIEAAKK